MSPDRIRMTDSVRLELDGGAAKYLRAGEYYLLDDETADELVEDGKAYPEGEPPTCSVCGASAGGIGAVDEIRRHEMEHHKSARLDWSPDEDQDPPPLDPDHPDVENLREMTTEEIREECHRIGVADADVVATGVSGKVKDDWIRHLLRAKGRRGFYRAEDTGEES